ncbi:tripeptidyl-peptidase II Tpp2 [Blyttiomyces sp. JEL0837]|nr:tripeptidyl-peptidase II Tpp2 [Blyttiomyces sp. JEL0837]
MHDFITPVKDFPISAVLPKEETQAASFIDKFPTYDGRGTIIAILDTGVDPGAIGMRVTTTGLPKVIHLIDCTGAGDVPCTTIVEATITKNADGTETKTVKGLTGRTLTIPSSWTPVDNKYRLGWKSIDGLFPPDLVNRLKADRKKKFEVEHHGILTELQEKILKHERDFGASPSDEKQNAVRGDWKAQLEALKEQMAAFEEPGMIFDCVLFNDGTKWRAAIDINESGNLNDAPLLTNFSDEHQYASFGTDSMLNFSVNIYDEGEMLSIVTTSDPHGTHVASITAANHPTDPKQNGVAPGAQIISLKIADTRIGSTETGTGFVRAAIELVRLKADVANISFGENTATNDIGRITEMLRDEVVNKSGCIILSSAGNDGPVLSSTSHPGGNSGIITVGAHSTPAMQDAMYMLLERVPERPFTWSSQGPTLDGAAGADIYAPGAAFTSVPQYTINSGQLMNGTSMACPNAAGCTALLVSALKQQRVPYNPYRVLAAIQNSAKDIGDSFKVGLFQVVSAWEHLVSHPAQKHNLDVFYNIAFTDRNRNRGLYLRELEECSRVQRQPVEVAPHFFKHEDAATNALKLQFEAQVALVSTQHWISAPEFVMIANSGREFLISVDPTKLTPGFHFGEILGYDTNQRSAGPLFRIPVTVCKPDNLAPEFENNGVIRYDNLQFGPGVMLRKFFTVPLGANFAGKYLVIIALFEVTFSSKDRIGKAKFFIHVQQNRNHTPHHVYEHDWRIDFGSTPSGSTTEEFKVKKTISLIPGVTAEFVICQFWSAIGDTEVSVEFTFHGLELTASNTPISGFGTNAGGDLIYLNAGNDGLTRCDLRAPVRTEDIAISVSLDTLRKSLRPVDSTIGPLKSRDVLTDSRRLHELVLTYTMKLTEETTITPFYPRTSFILYDSVLDNYSLFIFDAMKAFKSAHDIKGRNTKLKEGTYTLRVQFVSADVGLLEKLQTTPIVIEQKLAKPVTLSTYPSLGGLINANGAVKDKSLRKGESLTFWVAGVEGSALPKGSSPGDLLMGKFQVTTAKNTLFKAAYIVPSEVKAKDTPEAANTPMVPGANKPEEPKDDETQLKEAVRDLEITWLKKMKNDDQRKALIARLEAEHGKFLPFLVARLEVAAEQVQKAEKAKSDVAPLLEEVTNSVAGILSAIDQKELAVYFGLKVDLVAGGEAAKNKKKEMEAQKNAVILALIWKSVVLKHKIIIASAPKDAVALAAVDPSSKTSVDVVDELFAEFDVGLSELAQWLPSPPTSDGRYLSLWAWRLRRKGLLGAALKAVNKYLGDAKSLAAVGTGDADAATALATWNELLEIKKSVLEELGWTVWRKYEERWSVLRSPPSYTTF